jgi:hypothetical protein
MLPLLSLLVIPLTLICWCFGRERKRVRHLMY